MMDMWRILEGDCAATLATLPAESVDAVVTDTPYGLSTILDPPNLDREALWAKLTSGATESPIRTLMRAWLDTGDNPKVKGRGFMGKEWDALVPSPNTWRQAWRVMKPGAYLLAFGGTRTYALIEMSLRFADFEIEDGICTWLNGQGFPKRVRLDLKIDQHFGKAGERPVVRPRPQSSGTKGVYGAMSPRCEQMETSAATPEAARFVGWDRALRPGWEPIIVSCKPLRGTVAENALRYGTGGLHVDACRIERGDGGPMSWEKTRGMGYAADGGTQGVDHGRCTLLQDARGGYPANVILGEQAAEAVDAHTEGASRFFYVPKASSAERDAGLDDLPALPPGERCDREDGTAGINGYAGTRGEGGQNIHPTVKPFALMRYLCRLVAPPGAHAAEVAERPVILDPFTGSGTTGMAALAEGCRFVGCELMPEYVAVARRRLQHAWALPEEHPEAPKRKADAPGQRSLF